MKIAPVLIVKNEEVLLDRCLSSVKDLGEIFITDTGSTDKTIEIAKKYTDKISHFKWCDSFCKARNFAKSKCDADWILSIDADEVLQDVGAVREAVRIAEERGVKSIDCKLISENNPNNYFFFPRLFKNIPELYWEGDVHNTTSIVGEQIGDVRITVGYSPAHRNDPDRAFRILQKAAKEHPGPRVYYYLGREYFYRGDYQNTVIILGKYVQHSNFLSEKADAFLIMSKAYFYMGMGNDARDACAQALIINANFKEAILHMATIAGDGRGNEKWQKNADQWKKMAETADNSDVLFTRT